MSSKSFVKKLLAISSLLTVLVLLAACGDSQTSSSMQGSASSAQSGQGRANPCALLSKEDVAGVVSFAVAQPTSSDMANSHTCSFLAAETKNFVLTLTVLDQDFGKDQFQAQQITQEKFLNGKAQSVSGLGDSAYYVSGFMYVLKGNTSFSVSITNPELSDQQQMEQLKALAALVVKKL